MQFNGLTHPTCKILIKIKMQYKCLYTEFAMKIFLSFSLILIAIIGGLQHYVSVEQQSSEPYVVYADIADSAQVFDSFELKFLVLEVRSKFFLAVFSGRLALEIIPSVSPTDMVSPT